MWVPYNPFGLGDELLAQLFQQSLTGTTMRWFFGLDKTKIRTWEDVCHAFNSQYHYNLDVDVTRRELETTRQEEKESFAKFLTRWKKKAAQMIDRPTEQEQVDIIIKNLRPVYQTQLQTQYLPSFKSLVETANKVEDLIWTGQLKNESSGSRYKKTGNQSAEKANEVAN